MNKQPSFSDKIKELGAEVNKFQKFGLSGNPFFLKAIVTPDTIDEEELNRIFCYEIRANEIDRIFRVLISPSYENAKPTNVWIEGNPGLGKSMILLYIWSQLRVYRPDVIAFYTEIKREGFKLVWDEILRKENTGINFFRNIVLKLAARMVLANPELVENDADILDKLKKDEFSIREFLPVSFESEEEAKEGPKIDIAALSSVMKSELNQNGITTKLRDCLITILTDPVEGYNQLSQIPATVRTRSIAELFRVIRMAGYRMGYLFIDQLDYVFRYAKMTPNQKQSLVNDFRRFANETKIASVAATSYPDLSATEFKPNPQLMAALPLNKFTIVEIGSLNTEQAKAMTTKYLDSVKTKDSVPGLFPFTEPALEHISDAMQGNTRDIVTTLNGLLEAAADDPKVKTIDVDFVSQWIETEGKELVEGVEEVSEETAPTRAKRKEKTFEELE